MHGVGGEAARHSFIHDNDAGAGADLPAASVVYPIHRLLVHQEEGVTVFLNAGLQAIRGGYGPVAAIRLAVHEENSFAPLSAKDETGFDYIRKNKNGDCFRFNLGGRGALRDQLLQSGARLAGQIVGGYCASAKQHDSGEYQAERVFPFRCDIHMCVYFVRSFGSAWRETGYLIVWRKLYFSLL